MIIQPENIAEYLLRTEEWSKRYSSSTVQKLNIWKKRRDLHGLSPIEHAFIEHQIGNLSIRDLSKESEISYETIRKIFRDYKLPTLTHAEAVKANWKDEEFRKRNAEATKAMLNERWKDEEFRKRNAEAVKAARKSHIPQIKGYRADISKTTSTSGIANLIRISKYCGREELEKRIYEIEIPIGNKKSRVKKERLDLLVKDPRGNLIGYKILPRPQKNSFIRASLIEEKYGIKVKIITEEKYNRLEKWFKNKIDADKTFSGWETQEDNLKTNPRKYI